MKFDWRLDYSENMLRWREFRHNAGRCRYLDLTQKERASLETLNQHLTDIERRYYPAFRNRYFELTRRRDAPDEWLQDFNLELWLIFFLREDDPEWEDDCDNILTKSRQTFVPTEDFGFGCLHVNHIEHDPEFAGQHHCWSYHELYDHSELDWRDLLRIGSIGVEISVDEQSLKNLM